VVTVLDSGLDVSHPFFYDSKNTFYENARLDSHRKMVFYDSRNKKQDNIHGTRVASLISGSPEDENDLPSSYLTGIAPESKLYFVNIDFDAPDIESIVKQMKTFYSKVQCNSWGIYDLSSNRMTKLYDEIAYSNDDILFLFASGNEFAINQPSTSKNVLAVGGTKSLKCKFESSISFGVEYKLVSDNNEILATPLPYLEDLEPYKFIYHRKLYLKPKYSKIAKEFQKKAPTDFLLIDSCEDIGSINFGDVGLLIISCENNSVYDFFSQELNISIPILQIKSRDKDKLSSTVQIFLTKSTKDCGIDPDQSFPVGVTFENRMKPDLVAFSDVYSARSMDDPRDSREEEDQYRKENGIFIGDTNFTLQTGTSFSNPLVAGLAALILDYFSQGKYFGEQLDVKSTLLRAILINSGDSGKSAPDPVIGFGTPNLNNELGGKDFNSGFRVLNHIPILSDEHHLFFLKVDKSLLHNFSVTMSYLDPPIDDNWPLLAGDLDLVVEDPNGKLYYGNQNTEGDQFNTNEKIILGQGEVINGVYKVHIFCSTVKQDLRYSLAISGPFIHDDLEANAKFLTKEKTSSCLQNCNNQGTCSQKGQCHCKQRFQGIACQNVIPLLEENLTLRYQRSNYYQIIIPANSKSFEIQIDPDSLETVLYVCFSASIDKFSHGNWDCSDQSRNASFTHQIDSSEQSVLFIALIPYSNSDFNLSIHYEITPAQPSQPSDQSKSDILALILSIVGSVIIIGAIGGTYFYRRATRSMQFSIDASKQQSSQL
jgi:hypothetical protein